MGICFYRAIIKLRFSRVYITGVQIGVAAKKEFACIEALLKKGMAELKERIGVVISHEACKLCHQVSTATEDTCLLSRCCHQPSHMECLTRYLMMLVMIGAPLTCPTCSYVHMC